MEFMVEAFFSGCISKVINDGKDYSWAKIKSVINDKKDRNFFTRIYRVIEKALIKVINKGLKDTDDLYEAIEIIFIEFRDNGRTIESVKCGLELLGLDASDKRCEDFLENFYKGICQDDDLYKIISLILQEKGIDINQKEFQQLNKTVEYGFDQLNRKIDNLADSTIENSSNNDENKTTKSFKFQNNKKQDYIKNWNSRLFLHVNNKERPITLADAFIMPHYKMYINNEREYTNESLDQIIENFIEYNKTSTMLITGVPGIGKSTMTSWIANRYKYDERIIILRFRDWNREELVNGFMNAICSKLKCKHENLETKILVIDGFDEMKALDIGNRLLDELLTDIKDYENFKCIITSRPAYINLAYFYYVVELEEFDRIKVGRFYEVITGSSLNELGLNIEVLGIPVILYMAIMSDVNISEECTKPELYNKIFAERGGIFDKFNDGATEYSSGTQILRIFENTNIYLEFLRNTAFKMFEKKDLILSKNEYQIPKLSYQGKSVSVMEFPIKHLFDNTESNIEFIHKSIYEYFSSEYIFISIASVLNKKRKIENNLACVFGNILKKNEISPEIIEFLKYKILKNNFSNKFDIVNLTFQLMLNNGMTYYSNENKKNVIKCEINIFKNMLEIIHLWKKNYYLCSTSIYTYLKYDVQYLNLRYLEISKSGEENKKIDFNRVNLCKCYLNGSNLNNINLYNSDLSEANLEEANLRNAGLREANLKSANLKKGDLKKADLRNANLEKSNLRNADLREADLSGSILNNANLQGVNLKGAILKGAKLLRVNFREANLKEVSLEGADLSNADFLGAHLEGINLNKAILTGVIFDENQIKYLERKYELSDVQVLVTKEVKIKNYIDYSNKK